MPSIQLRESRIEMIEGRSFALFSLSESPDPTWIVRFEACLGKRTGVAVVVIGQRVRTDLPQSGELPQLVRLVQQCIEEANIDGELPPDTVLA